MIFILQDSRYIFHRFKEIIAINHDYYFLSGHSTNWKTFAEVKSQNLGQDKPDYFTAKGTIVYLKKDNCMYQVWD